jgi:hypothetical protein
VIKLKVTLGREMDKDERRLPVEQAGIEEA